MALRDIFQAINELDAESIQRVVDRLEYRGKYAPFVQMCETYLDRMQFAPDGRILDLGCGTGIVARAIAARAGFRGQVVGIDFSSALIEAATRFSEEEGVASLVMFQVGDAQRLEEADAIYDAVVIHTLVSHVPDPAAVVSEAARVVRPGGLIAIFDGDYASLTYATGDHALDAELVRALLTTVVANPYAMRELPAMLQQAGLGISDFLPHVLAEAGQGVFFSSLAETYAPIVAQADLVSGETADSWLAANRQSSTADSFFASCNYYTYLAQRPEAA